MSGQETILIVDDDPDIVLALSDFLRQEGFTVDSAATAQETFEQIRSRSYGAILLDVGLPDRDGLDVLNDLSKQYPHLPVILLTACASIHRTANPVVVEQAFAYLSKPYSREEVRQTLKRAVQSTDTAQQSKP